MKEVWKDIEGYEGLYQVSNIGRVKSLGRMVRGKKQTAYFTKERILKSRIGKTGYEYVCLYKDSKQLTANIHRLVANAFVNNEENFDTVNHKDGNKQNNHFSNLEWCTNKENIRHAFDTGLVKKCNMSKGHIAPDKIYKNNSSGRKGVYFNKGCNKWQAYIKINGKTIYLGVYENIEDAIKAREAKERELL